MKFQSHMPLETISEAENFPGEAYMHAAPRPPNSTVISLADKNNEAL